MEFLFSKLLDYKLHPSSIRVFKAPEINSLVDFLSTETAANRFSPEYVL